MQRRSLLMGMSAAGALLAAGSAFAQTTGPLEVSSPGGVLSVRIGFGVANIDTGIPTYEVRRFGRAVVSPSKLGFRLADAPILAPDMAVTQVERRSVDNTWEQPWGEKRFIRNHFNELAITFTETTALKRSMRVVFRVYDDGIGMRYELPDQPNLKNALITEELTEFRFTEDATAWWIPARQPNRYEYLYNTTPLDELFMAHTPVTMRTQDGLHISIHEAALVDYAAMVLRRTGKHTFQADLTPWSDGIRVRAKTPFVTPWRTLQIADTAGGLITSYLILNLNEPNALGDVSWVEPGKYVGVWWEMHLGTGTWGSGPKHSANTANVKRYIDFAAEHGFSSVLVEGWNIGWDGDWYREGGSAFEFAQPYPDFDLPELARYAKARKVRLIGHHETAGNVTRYESQLAAGLDLYERHGVRVIKTGYVADAGQIQRVDENGVTRREYHDSQFMARHHLHVVKEAAKRKISINPHEPIKDTGLRRTYPNWVAREGARGQEYNAWGNPGNPPEHTAIIPFTRMLGGPMDYTPGVFDLLNTKRANRDTRVETTLAKELALYVILYSPIQMACDLPEHYEARMAPFQFIKDVACDWEDTRVLHAEIGDYVTIARKARKSEDWFLGSLTDETGRLLTASLDFLDLGRIYKAQIYRDGPKADFTSEPYDMEILEGLVTAQTQLALRLAAGGGQAIRFTPASAADRRKLRKL